MKTKTIYVCQNCGAESLRWIGKCPSCESWNSYVEELNAPLSADSKRDIVYKEAPVLLKDVLSREESRITTEMGEFDRVLGGGIVPGSVTLIGGDPGIGKSTLSLQISCALSQKKYKVLYVSGEESIKQTKMRADRIISGISDARGTPDSLRAERLADEDLSPLALKENLSSLYLVNQIDLNSITDYIRQLKPQIIVLDSIQVVYQPEISSSPGSVAQVRECSALLTHLAKSMGIALFIIGHVTKEGMLAGPRVLEHIVDTVLYFEGERYSVYRVLRATKNRFGSTNEIGVFEMTSVGLMEVTNPSEIFLSQRPKKFSGSVVACIMEGTRPFLVEVQGLVSRSNFGMVRQKAQGFDANRLALLTAVLEKRIGLNLQDKDIFLNIVGGVKVTDPAADLAVVMAVASAFTDKVVPFDTMIIGEVGLSSEIRSVSQVGQRINEAERLGFKKCLLPKNNLNRQQGINNSKIALVGVETVREALDALVKE